MVASKDPFAKYRTEVLFARDAPLAVLCLRHGDDHNHLISWDLQTDTFTHGQWMRGRVVITDLSPDGSKLLYFAAQYHKRPQTHPQTNPLYSGGSLKEIYAHGAKHSKRSKRKIPHYMGGGSAKNQAEQARRSVNGTWTALSRVPYFSALAFWPAVGTWTGGGIFKKSAHVCLFEENEGLKAYSNAPLPRHFRAESAFEPTTDLEFPIPRCASSPHDLETPDKRALRKKYKEAGMLRCDWIHETPNGDLLVSGDGKIYRLPESRLENADRADLEDVSIADFTEQRFAELEPPKLAMQW